ncbi:glycine-rich domain-containing protein-like [Schlegelella sp. S2-27]|uniref:Glycine-rich domain-containing protein-like n=1 Tax=Caldimonas mangrovi TaxID=2944811 RepID=A0ABT0YRE1_9BURK|nr:glycine-rich domain-containing protein-like [Caldimonas mangrovi]MCM5681291.1 glycine-rich domain-containing protein-like [Caldimonas mangrovi]
MQQHTLDHILAGIEGLDLEPIKFKLTCEKDEYRWSREHAERIEVGYKRFLALMAKYPERAIAPTRDIDTFWHAHILDTRKYAADCQRVFGEFVHHYPYVGLQDDEADQQAHADAGAAMDELYLAEFGEELPDDAAFCVREPQQRQVSAAFCVGQPQSVPSGAAFCVRKPEQAKKSAAFCVRKPEQESAAFCVREPEQESAAFCVREPVRAEKSAAFCVRKPDQAVKKTAFCVRKPVQTQKSAAFCVRRPEQAEKSTAFCVRGPQQMKKTVAFCVREPRPQTSVAFCVRQPLAA